MIDGNSSSRIRRDENGDDGIFVKEDIRFPEGKRVIGANQTIKLIRAKKARMIFLASDADNSFKAKILGEINKSDPVPVNAVYNSKKLGEMAGIEVSCAVVAFF